MPPAKSVLLAEELYRLVGRTRRMLWMATAKCLEGRDESIFRWQAVCYLVRNGAASQRDLAYATAQDPAGISRLVDELEGAGLITRTPDPDDRRRQLVKATAKGKTWLDELTPHVMADVDDALKRLGQREREELRGLLRQLLGE